MLKGALGKIIGGGGNGSDTTSFNLATPYGRLQAFFHEIETTTIARRLTLTIADAEMTFDLQNKKVLRLIEMKPDTDGRGAIAARIERDYNALDGQLKLLAELITTFVARGGSFDMVSRTSPVNYPPKTDGFPAAEWRFACDLYGVVPANAVPEVNRSPAAPVDEPAPVKVAAPVAAPAPAPQKQPAYAAAQAGYGEADPISTIITSLTSSPAPVAAPAPAPAAAAPVAAFRDDADPRIVKNFYESVAKHCELAMLLNESGDVLELTDSAAGWLDIGPDLARDMKSWVQDTARIMPGCQLVMMRSPILQNHSVIFMTNGSVTAFGAFASHVTGRLFSIANDFVGQKRPA